MTGTPANETTFKPKTLRHSNYRTIINLFRNANELSIRNISDLTRLSKTSATKIVNLLVEKNIVLPIGKGSSTDEGGKKPEMYSLNPDYHYCLSLTFDGFSCIGRILNANLKVVHSYSLDSNYRRNYKEALDAIIRTINELMKLSNLAPEMLFGITLSCSGVVDVHQGLLLEPIRDTHWGHNIPVMDDVKRLLPFKTNFYLDNLCRFSGYFELIGHPTRNEYTFIVISTGDTTGGCIIQQGNLVQGNHGLVGEFGHVRTDYNTSRKCSCGNVGCFEAMVSSSELISEAERNAPATSSLYAIFRHRHLEMGDIFDAANEGDPFSRTILDNVIHQFAVLINNVRFICDPKEIIIQGIYAFAGSYFEAELHRQVSSSTFYSISTEANISLSRDNILDTIHIGASKYNIDCYFESEII